MGTGTESMTNRADPAQPGPRRAWGAGLLLALGLLAACGGGVQVPQLDPSGRVPLMEACQAVQDGLFEGRGAWLAPQAVGDRYATGYERTAPEPSLRVRFFHDRSDHRSSGTREVVAEWQGRTLPEMSALREDSALCLMALGFDPGAARDLVARLWKEPKRSYEAEDGAHVFEWRLEDEKARAVIQHHQYAQTQQVYFGALRKKP